MTTPATDGPVWRDRGAIIAQQQTRIAELEAERDKAREEAGQQRMFAKTFAWERDNFIKRALDAEAELAALRGRIEALATRLRAEAAEVPDQGCVVPIVYRHIAGQVEDALAASPAEDTTPAAPHAEDGALGWLEREFARANQRRRETPRHALPAPVADPSGDTEGGRRG